MKASRHKIALILLSIITTLLGGCLARSGPAEMSAAAPGGTALKLAPVSDLPPEFQQLPARVQGAYRFALANRDVLELMPCYCGCNQVGHENNRMCYVQSETADGRVVLDRHAVT